MPTIAAVATEPRRPDAASQSLFQFTTTSLHARLLPAAGCASSRQPADAMRIQAVDVEAIGGLGRTRGLGIGAARVLQAGRDASFLVDGKDVPVRLAKRQKEPRQPQQDLAQKRPLGEAVRRR